NIFYQKEDNIRNRNVTGVHTCALPIWETDVIIENFRPGTLEKLNLSYEELSEINPKIMMVRISGYGQTGPYKYKAGFGSIGESRSEERRVGKESRSKRWR